MHQCLDLGSVLHIDDCVQLDDRTAADAPSREVLVGGGLAYVDRDLLWIQEQVGSRRVFDDHSYTIDWGSG